MGLLIRTGWLRSLVAGGLFILGTGRPASAQAGTPSLEYRVKAAYLLNFTRYVDWPPPPPQAASLDICVLGQDPFGVVLDQAIEGRRSHGRPLFLRRLQTEEEARSCHLVFLTDEAWTRRRELVTNLTSRGILTVGNSDQFVRSGGVIAFVISNETVRFVVNLNAMERSGLRISSRMLSLAMELQSTEGPRY